MSKRIGVVFPGYGQQFIGMGKDLYDELRTVQEFFEQAAGTAEINFVKLLFASSDEEILSIRSGYLAIFLFEASLYEVLHQRGLKPDFVAGYGIGEYAAAYASRSLNFVDALYLLNKYSQFYDEFIKDKDYTVLRVVREFDIQSIEELCKKKSTEENPVSVSAQNTNNAFYISGALKAIEKIQKHCVEEVIRKVKNVGPGYELHSDLVNEVVERLRPYYHKIQFRPLEVPVITNVEGVYVTSPDALESAIMRKINNRVQWLEVMKGFEGCDVILSVGPGDQLIEWFKEVYPDKEYHIVSSLKDIVMIESLFFSPLPDILKIDDLQEADTKADYSELEHHDQDIDKDHNHEIKNDLLDADLINELPSDFDDEDED
ncbi:MAG: ACP S-malonyltransferase [Candidatus Dependentiae bacterium]|nr:ACP S-malonyltransferase [Candidatus Dependentiae bacterium]